MKPVHKNLCLTAWTLAVNLALVTGCAPAPEKTSEAPQTPPFESLQMKGVESVTVAVDADAAARRLGKAVTFPTISNQGRNDFDVKAYEGFHKFLAQTYPLTHKTLKRDIVGGPRA